MTYPDLYIKDLIRNSEIKIRHPDKFVIEDIFELLKKNITIRQCTNCKRDFLKKSPTHERCGRCSD